MTQYKHIVSAGCSFIHGSELGDEVPFSRHTYPALIANEYKTSYECLAYPSASNQGIAKKVLSHKPKPDTLYIIQWTYPSRFGVSLNFTIQDKNKNKTNWFDLAPNSWDYNPKAFHEYTEYTQQLIDLGIPDLSEQYYKFTGNHEQFMFQTLLCIKAVSSHLQQQNAKGIFFTATTDLVAIPEVNGFNNRGFVDWCDAQGFEVGPYKHPLHEAHRYAAINVMENLSQ